MIPDNNNEKDSKVDSALNEPILSPFSTEKTTEKIKKANILRERGSRRSDQAIAYPYNASDAKGNPKSTLDNVVIFLENSPRFRNEDGQDVPPLYYDAFYNYVVVDGERQTDTNMSGVRIYIEQDSGIEKVGKDLVWDAVDYVAEKNKLDHAVQKLEEFAAAWDGTERMYDWLANAVPGTPKDDYHRAIGYSWLLAMARRQLVPGLPFKYILTLIGKQSVGKAEWVNNQIPTPNGIKRFGDLKVGDFVYGSKGNPIKVLGTFPQGKRQLYRVIFIDGTSALFDGDHIFTVVDRSKKKYVGKYFTKTGQKASKFIIDETAVNITVSEMIENGLRLKNGGCPYWKYSLPKYEALHGNGGTKKDAYALGLWLADGHKGCGEITKPYKEVWDKLKNLGWETSYGKTKDKITSTVKGLHKVLKKHNIIDLTSKERYIPEECFYWSTESRKELLAGLLDGNSECSSSGVVVYSSSSKKLALDVQRLSRTLGIQTTELHIKKAILDGKRYDDSYRFSLSVTKDYYTIKHRKERAFGERKNTKKSIVSIIPEIIDDAMCIAVDSPDHLYITQDYILTHNTGLFSCLTACIDDEAAKNVGDISKPDTVLALSTGTLIGLFDEGVKMGKKENEEIKEFVARTADTIRAPYGRAHKTFKRRWVCGMTENNFDALTDATGNDRYWVVEVSRMIDFAWIEANREQLLGEAYTRAKRGEEYIFPDRKYANEIQNRHRQVHPWEENILNWLLDQKEYITNPSEYILKGVDLWKDALKGSEESFARLDFNQRRDISNCMKALGFVNATKWVDGKNSRVWKIQPGSEDVHLDRINDFNARKNDFKFDDLDIDLSDI